MDSFRLRFIEKADVEISAKSLLHLSKSDHILWKWRVYNLFLGHEKISVDQVSSHHVCRLGKWYNNEETKRAFGNIPAYQKLLTPHARVHSAAKDAVSAFNNGDLIEANKQLGQLEQASNEVLQCINNLLAKV